MTPSTNAPSLGRRVLVTGSSRGIGAEIAHAFARNSDHVAVHGRDQEALRHVHDRITADGGSATVHTGDLTNEEQVRNLLAEVGDLDVLVVNAGGASTGFGPIDNLDAEDFRRTLDANLTAAFLTIKAAMPRMTQRGTGAVITISSTVARHPSQRSPAAYVAAKAGLESLTKTVAVQAGPHGIRANCIAPATILTETNKQRIPPATQDDLARSHPLQRLGLPSDVAGLAVFLASQQASWLTGTVIDLDRGASLRT